MAGIETLVQITHAMNVLRAPVLHAAIQALDLPQGSRGLDAGCGIGMQAVSLAKAVGPAGHVTGLDLSPEILVYAAELARQAGLSRRISFQEGDVNRLPFDENSFDWAWSVDCVGYMPVEPLPLIKELARVVKPGGRIAILAWSSERLLPGYPLLEAKLSATSAGIAPFSQEMPPESHFSRALGWFREAGLEGVSVRTFTGEAHAPLTDDLRSALRTLIQMRWSGAEPELSEEDRALFRRHCLPGSPEFIVHSSDYYAFFTYSMFHGTVAE